MSPNTEKAYRAIEAEIARGCDKIVPALFSHCYGRAATSAAFRKASADGLIEVAYISCLGGKVWRAAGLGDAMAALETASVN